MRIAPTTPAQQASGPLRWTRCIRPRCWDRRFHICWSFFAYSFLGVLLEGIFCLAAEGVLEARLGLLYLPPRPLYGIGGVACALLLDRSLHQPIWISLFGILICTVVEYLASVVMEKAFGAISWDYRDKPLNVNGRICLHYSLCWGLLALFALYVVDPFLTGFLGPVGARSGEVMLTALLTITLLSAVVTLAAWARIKKRVTALRASVPGEAVIDSDTRGSRVVDRLAPDRLMNNSFPQMSLMTDLMELSGEQQPRLTLPRHPCRTLPSTRAPQRRSPA